LCPKLLGAFLCSPDILVRKSNQLTTVAQCQPRTGVGAGNSTCSDNSDTNRSIVYHPVSFVASPRHSLTRRCWGSFFHRHKVCLPKIGGAKMRAVVQRVSEAWVEVEGQRVAQIGRGLLVLLGVGQGDTEEDARYLASKIANLRVFEDEEGKLNRSVLEIGGSVLVVSNFTLYGDCRKGRRPSFTDAAPPEIADQLYRRFCEFLAAEGVPVQTGVFQAHMHVGLINDGPVTLLLDSKKQF